MQAFASEMHVIATEGTFHVEVGLCLMKSEPHYNVNVIVGGEHEHELRVKRYDETGYPTFLWIDQKQKNQAATPLPIYHYS